ncbi:MAG: oxidative damage protection protein [Acidobacteriota bacterium]
MTDAAPSSTTLQCARCDRQQPPMARPPIPGPQGAEILQRVCNDCWEEWEHHEVMVINELRLNFMDPEAQTILTGHMREFLKLDGAGEEEDAGHMDSFARRKAATEAATGSAETPATGSDEDGRPPADSA